MQNARKQDVQLEVVGEVEHSGLTFPKGMRLKATASQIGVPAFGGKTNWTEPEYVVELTAAKITELGGNAAGVVAMDYDVTKHVKSGNMKLV